MLIINEQSLRDKMKTLKINKDSKYLNSEINRVKLGNAIFNKKKI